MPNGHGMAWLKGNCERTHGREARRPTLGTPELNATIPDAIRRLEMKDSLFYRAGVAWTPAMSCMRSYVFSWLKSQTHTLSETEMIILSLFHFVPTICLCPLCWATQWIQPHGTCEASANLGRSRRMGAAQQTATFSGFAEVRNLRVTWIHHQTFKHCLHCLLDASTIRNMWANRPAPKASHRWVILA